MNRFLATLAFFSILPSFAEPEAAGRIHWDFPRLGNCHEGMAFADGVTGVLVFAYSVSSIPSVDGSAVCASGARTARLRRAR